MNAAQNMALSLLIATHNAEQKSNEPIVQIVKAKEPKEVKAAPIHRKPVTTVMPGTLNAGDFIMAMRKAGQRRNDKGAFYTDPKEVMGDKIKAIQAYCGYDSRLNLGGQEQSALTRAQREMKPAPILGLTRAEQREKSRSLVGRNTALPDHNARKLADLKAREVAAVESMIQHEKAGRDMARSDNDRMLSDGLAQVERERLIQIRADIQSLE